MKDLSDALAAGLPPPTDGQPMDPSRAGRLAIEAAIRAADVPQTTLAERGVIVRTLSDNIGNIARCATHAPNDFERLILALSICPGMGKHAVALRRAVMVEVDTRARATTAVRRQDPKWQIGAKLSRTKAGEPKPSYANIVTIIGNDARWTTLRQSALGEVVELDGAQLREAEGTARACEWLRDEYQIDAQESAVKSAIFAIASTRRYSPVVDYLSSVRGKGRGEIARLLVDVLGCPPVQLHQDMIVRFLVGAVARVLRPGCKLDTCLVLVGRQGKGKSSFFSTLFGPFFGDTPLSIGDKDTIMQQAMTWGYEVAEIDDILQRRTASAVKAHMTITHDLYRPPYARAVVRVPRSSVLCATTNKTQFLTDPTGSRRFWVLPVSEPRRINLALLADLRDSVWADALALYDAGEPWWLTEDEDAQRAATAGEFSEHDPWIDRIERWITEQIGTPFSRADVLANALSFEPHQVTRSASMRVAECLTTLGYSEVSSPSKALRGRRVWLIDETKG